MILIWGKFLGLLVLIYVFGTRAAKSADTIAQVKGLTRAFMGVVFISMITSFPELFTGLSATVLVKSPDLAVGEILGSCLFNLFIIALVEVIFQKRKLYVLTGKINLLPLGFSLMIVGMLTLAISHKTSFKIFHIGIYSVLIMALYLIFMRTIYRERKDSSYDKQEKKPGKFKNSLITFIISSLVIIGIGIYLPVVGSDLAQIMGWSDSFVGVIFLAFVTSFPELVISIASAKIGAIDMLIGNIAGSNLFNVAIIFFIDLVYKDGLILNAISRKYVSVGVIAVLMNFIIIFAIMRRSTRKVFNLISINALSIIALYIFTLVIIY